MKGRTMGERFWTGTNNNPKWTDEKVENLRVLLLQDLSASQLAERLGFGTRNAIIGKLKRLGLRLPNKQNQSGRSAKAKTKDEHLTRRRGLRKFLKNRGLEKVFFF